MAESKLIAVNVSNVHREFHIGEITIHALRGINIEVYEGEFQLVLPLDVSSKQVKQFEEYLRTIEDLMILSTGWSSDEGSVISVSLQRPMTLLHFFNEMPTVEKVYKKERKIIIKLKTLLDNSGNH